MRIDMLREAKEELNNLLLETKINKFKRISDCAFQRQKIVSCINLVDEMIEKEIKRRETNV